ncbi:MAG: response regulator [Nitrosomonadales bacterium]|nr:response regulator [Nitrosomonadales bacterium]
MNRNKYSIHLQVAWLTLVPMLVMTVSLEAFFLHTRFSDLDHGLLERGKLIARQLASSSEYGVFSNNQTFLQNIANGVLQQPDVRGVAILNAASEPMIEAGEFTNSFTNARVDATTAVPGSITQTKLMRSREVKDSVNLLTPIRHNHEGLWIYQPIIPAQVMVDEFDTNPAIQQVGAVIVEMSNVQTQKLKIQMLSFAFIATVLFLGCSLYLAYLASRSITKPIRNLSDAIETIGKGNLETRVSLLTHVSELDTLSHGINDMAEKLQKERTFLQQRVGEATQALREKMEEAERTSHDKSHFLAVASHDLRQPIHALGLYIAELRRKITGAEQLHLVGQVEHSVDAISTLINALLDISKLDAGVVVPQKQACDISALLERVTTDFQMLARIKNIRLVVRPFHGYAVSDPVLLERILMNLVSNALRYTHPNGIVLIACRRRGNRLRIEVRDNGIGISKADQANIFREFFQLMQPQLDTQKGLGLGLAIVDRLVKLLEHRIELRSAPNKGSTFALELPAASAPIAHFAIAGLPALPASEQATESTSLAGKRLLIVDDDALVLESTTAILNSWGCKVSAAASLEAVQKLLVDGAAWDLIISDYQLGNDVTGLDVIETVRQHLNKVIPCILISGDTSPAVLKLASVAGHHLLHKPVKPAKLRSLVLYLLEEEEFNVRG